MESLDEFCETETMKDDNAYYCENCKSKQTAEKSIKFKTLPTILNFQLKRYHSPPLSLLLSLLLTATLTPTLTPTHCYSHSYSHSYSLLLSLLLSLMLSST